MMLFKDYFSINKWMFFLSFSVINILIVFLTKKILINEDVFYNSFQEQISYEKSLELYETLMHYGWTSFILTPLVFLLKAFIITVIIYIGFIITGKLFSISMRDIFSVVLASEIWFVVGGLAKFISAFFLKDISTINDLTYYYPLSLLSIFNYHELDPIWLIPFQTLNLFHLCYIIFLALGIQYKCKVSRSDAERIILTTYLPSLFIWILIIMFFSIH